MKAGHCKPETIKRNMEQHLLVRPVIFTQQNTPQLLISIRNHQDTQIFTNPFLAKLITYFPDLELGLINTLPY